MIYSPPLTFLSLQATTPMEQESWICAVHSACASSFARHHGKDNTLRLMKKELHNLETNIDVVSDQDNFCGIIFICEVVCEVNVCR